MFLGLVNHARKHVHAALPAPNLALRPTSGYGSGVSDKVVACTGGDGMTNERHQAATRSHRLAGIELSDWDGKIIYGIGGVLVLLGCSCHQTLSSTFTDKWKLQVNKSYAVWPSEVVAWMLMKGHFGQSLPVLYSCNQGILAKFAIVMQLLVLSVSNCIQRGVTS